MKPGTFFFGPVNPSHVSTCFKLCQGFQQSPTGVCHGDGGGPSRSVGDQRRDDPSWCQLGSLGIQLESLGKCRKSSIILFWWFGTWLVFFHILGTIISTDYMFFSLDP